MNGFGIFLTGRTKDGDILERETLRKNQRLEFRNLNKGASLRIAYDDGTYTITSRVLDYSIENNIITIFTLNSIYTIEVLNFY